MLNKTIHYRNLRLRNNAGMDFPHCYASARLLDCDKSRLPTSGKAGDVTCKRCIRILARDAEKFTEAVSGIPCR